MAAVSNSSSSAKGSTVKSSGATSASVDQPEFVLKHRVAGAAFLLFFGALVLPWILGAPGEAKIADAGEVNSLAAETEPGKRLNEDLVNAIAGEEEELEEQVYISKITPLDNAQINEQGNPDATSNSNAGTGSDATTEVPTTAPESISTPPVTNSIPDTTSKATTDEKKPANEPEGRPQVAPVSDAAATEIEVGWIVQVGVFTDKRGAARVVDDLEGKGFSPSTTIVDTNRGKATGTRIWLGPYAQRVDAAKAKSELTDKTGEAGFIRAFP